MTARERNERIRGAKSAAELISILTDTPEQSDAGSADIAQAVDTAASESCCRAASLVLDAAPEPDLLKFMLYPADCNNIKTAVKAQLRGVPCDDILSNEGSIPSEKLADMLADRDFSELPPHMKKAVPEAIDAYVKRKNPQIIDLLVDCACFADMTEAAEKTGSPVLVDYAHRRADSANIMTFLRQKRGGAPLSLLNNSLVEGGSIGADVFESAYEEGASALAPALSFTGYSFLQRRLSGSGQNQQPDYSVIEREAEDYTLSVFAPVRFQAFGIEVLAAYLASRFTEAKNARITAAMLSGSPSLGEMHRTGHI